MLPQRINGDSSSEWTNTPVVSAFLPPYNEPYDPYEQNVLGGSALNYGPDGRMYQQWTIKYNRDTSFLSLGPRDGDAVWARYEDGIRSVSVAFDNNMSQVVAWRKDDGCYMYYYDTVQHMFAVRSFMGATACRVFVDDSRDSYNASSDVIFVYTLNNQVLYRRQRDRYDIPYFIGTSNRQLQRAGPTIGYRVQIELI